VNLSEISSVYLQELVDTGVYKFECANQHATTAYLREERFEILYELAANAILDGYYREGVTSFTSSFEAFCEFYLRVQGYKKGVPPDLYDKALNTVVARSERVLGAYTMNYTLEHKAPPPALQGHDVEFRNNVTHRGKIPSRKEAENYGQKIIDVIHPVLAKLKVHEMAHVSSVINARISRLCSQTSSTTPPISMTFPGIINIARTSPDPHPILLHELTKLESRRKQLGW
jgi:hypothetical protein